MARRQSRFRVSVEGLSELAALPDWLDSGQREFLRKAADRLAESIAEAAPGGTSGRIGRATRGRVLSPTRAEVVVEHPGARALEYGAYIAPKRGKTLRFKIGGETVYVRGGVRIKARAYAKRGLRARGRIVRGAFKEAFDELGPKA